MENISSDKNKNFPKLSLNKFKSKKNIQIKHPFFTEAFSITNKNKNEFLSPIKTETIIMNSYSLNNIKNNAPNKNSNKHINKGVLYKYVNPSYFKNSLGSIPSKSEKILLNNVKIDRFSNSNSLNNNIKENTPGVGSYNLIYDWKLKNKSVKIESEEKRFQDFNNLLPGVGEYNLDNGQKIQNEKNNLRYSHLYSRSEKKIHNYLNEYSKDNTNSYNLNIINDIINKNKKYNFCSYSSRNDYRGSKIPTFFDKANNNPGPGQYFQNLDNFSLKNRSYSIRNKDIEEIDNSKNNKLFLSEYLNEIKDEGDKPSFNMKQNGNKRENKVYNLEDIYKLKRNNKKIVISRNEELDKKLREIEKNNSHKNLYFHMRQNVELQKIKNILGNDNGKPDLFYLSPERWKNKRNTFRVPGPAYYFY